MQTGLTSILITSYQRFDFVSNLLGSIYKSTSDEYEVVVCNTSPDFCSERNVRLEQLACDSRMTLVTEGDQTFLEGCETALHASRGEWIVLLNDDTLVPREQVGWLAHLRQHLQQRPSCGCVAGYQKLPNGSMYTTGELDYSRPGYTCESKVPLDQWPAEVLTLWNPFSYAMFRRSHLERHRFLDIVPKTSHHYNSDVVYSRDAILRLGLSNAMISDTWIYHIHDRTFQGEIEGYEYSGR